MEEPQRTKFHQYLVESDDSSRARTILNIYFDGLLAAMQGANFFELYEGASRDLERLYHPEKSEVVDELFIKSYMAGIDATIDAIRQYDIDEVAAEQEECKRRLAERLQE